MTFEHSSTVTTSATPDAIWKLWSDTTTWSTWDPAVERVVLEGEFVVGAEGTMTLRGGIEAPFTLEVVETHARYLDQLAIGDLVIRIDHLVRATSDGAQITVSTTIEGPGADDVGPMVTADAPVALEALVDQAEGR